MSNERTELSPDQISLLTDAELNRACAEHVMRWEYVHNPGAVNVCNWSPATSLADAAKCTEVMIEAGWTIEITLYKKIGCSCTIWRFSERSLEGLDTETAEMFDTREKQQDRYHVRAATEPRARAEACLRAAMREEG